MEDQKMGSMPIHQLLVTMAAPMILSMMIGALYNIVDSIFVSNYSEEALTAVSLAFPIQNIIVALGTGVGVGVNALLSRLLGEKNQKAVNKTAGNGLLLGFFVYFILLPAAYLLGRQFQAAGVWMAFPVTEILVMIFACFYLKHVLKKL